MQFTGLQDKNGVDIYEGDIVECWDDAATDHSWGSACLGRIHRGVIEYVDGAFILRVPGELEYDGVAVKRWATDIFLDQWLNAENIKKVGNLYENPELTCKWSRTCS